MIILFSDSGSSAPSGRKPEVHRRVFLRHPDVTDMDVEVAWRNAIAMRLRNMEAPAHIVAAGADTKGRLIEMVGVELENDRILIYHAQRLTAKMRAELGL